MAGLRTVDEAVAHPPLRRLVESMMHEEIVPTLAATPGFDLDDYAARIVARYTNPALQHRLRQIAMDGSQKLPQRLLGTVRDRLRAGAGIERLALAVAGWLHYLRGHDEAGEHYSIDDPMAATLAALRAGANSGTEEDAAAFAVLNHAPVFGDLGANPAFTGPVLRWLGVLAQHGALAAASAASGAAGASPLHATQTAHP
jgi:fructuronate reductase